MHTYAYIRSRCGARDGLALITVLAFIVLLTILVVSFITFSGLNRGSTANYSKSIQAQEIAEGGIQDILNDLHQEIVAGSTAQNGGSSSYPNVYIPTTNFTAAPARIGYAPAKWSTDITAALLGPTLVRVSRASATAGAITFNPTTAYNTTYYTGTLPINRASQSSTGTASVNGRYISPTRWNKPYLLAPTVATIPTPFYAGGTLPSTTYPATPDLPDWVYVTRTGSRVCNVATDTIAALLPSNNLANNYGTITPGVNPPASPIVGRYAFVMYDEGALLDVNAAGYLAAATNNTTATPSYTNVISSGALTNNIQTLSGKSYLAYADLTQLPGFNGTGGQTNVDNLVKWRNAGGLAGATTGTAYLGAMTTNAANGFLSFGTSGTTGDSPFVSRQDLINYFTSIDPNINKTTATVSKALPYLGTFSRELNAASYYPPLDAAFIPGYKNSALPNPLTPDLSPVPTYNTSMETSGIPNRDLANVRFASAATVTHYNDDASSSTYSVSAGDPLLQRRFSLARIAWLSQTWAGQADPGSDSSTYASSTYPAAIQACFGLVWDYPAGISTEPRSMANGGNKCWNYVGSTLSGPGSFTATSSSPAGTIETLDQVAMETIPREPNFFELLKAAILNGSLGKTAGTCGASNGTMIPSYSSIPNDYNLWDGGYTQVGWLYGTAGYFSYSFDGHWQAPNNVPSYLAPSAIPDCQIIQIGANIMSQFSADSYPTAIYFKYSGVGGFDAVSMGPTPNGENMTPIYGPVDMFYGDENLPYIHAMFPIQCSPDPVGVSTLIGSTWIGGTTNMAAWMQPQLWNPHQQPATALFPNGQKYQMRAYNEMEYRWGWSGQTGGAAYPNAAPWFLDNSSSTANPTATINFTDSSTTSSFYAHPYLLTADSIPSYGAATVTCPTSGALTNATMNIAQSTYADYTASANIYHFVGFYFGTTPNPSQLGASPQNVAYYSPTSGQGHNENRPWDAIGTGTKPLNCNTYSLGWIDSSNNFHPYSYLAGAFGYAYSVPNAPGDVNGTCQANAYAAMDWAFADPRTSRFSEYSTWFSGETAPLNTTPFATSTIANKGHSTSGMPNGGRPSNMPNGSGFIPENTPSAHPSDWLVNSATIDTAAGENSASIALAYYADPDGVIRPGDGFFGSGLSTGSPAGTGDGEMLFTSAGAPTGGKYALGDQSTSNGGNISHGRRPIILNRPFRNVGELGYTFRDVPYKTLDFFSTASADAGLLDVFSVTDEPKVVAGRLSLNNAPKPVIQAVLSQGSKKDYDPSYNIGVEPAATLAAPLVATGIATNLKPTGSGPLLNRAGLVTQLGVNPTLTRAQLLTTPPIYSALYSDGLSADAGNKAYYEAPMRALSSVTNTRTWNLMIDIIAQSGHLAPNATSLDNFVVEGEKRYWLHIAIDRYTGKIVDQQLEPVYE